MQNCFIVSALQHGREIAPVYAQVTGVLDAISAASQQHYVR